MNLVKVIVLAGLVASAAVGCAASRESLISTRDNVTDAQFKGEIRKSDVPVLVVLGASWCDPCFRVRETLDDLAGEYDGWVSFMFINADTSLSVANAMGVNSIPTMILFDGGKEVERRGGDVDHNEVRAMLNRVLEVEP